MTPVRYIISIAAFIACIACSAQQDDLDRVFDDGGNAYDEATKAVAAMIESNSFGMGSAEYELSINNATYSVGKCKKNCESLLIDLNKPITKLDAIGCTRSVEKFRKAATLARSAITELSKAETGFSSGSGAANPFYQQRVYREAASQITTARRYIQMIADEMTEAVSLFSDCMEAK